MSKKKVKIPAVICKIWDPSKTIRDWDPENINWDDETVCALCGKKEDCECIHYKCPCGKREVDCGWPDSVECPCRVCLKLYVDCKCDKPDKFTDEEWTIIRTFKYNTRYNWKKDIDEINNEGETENDD